MVKRERNDTRQSDRTTSKINVSSRDGCGCSWFEGRMTNSLVSPTCIPTTVADNAGCNPPATRKKWRERRKEGFFRSRDTGGYGQPHNSKEVSRARHHSVPAAEPGPQTNEVVSFSKKSAGTPFSFSVVAVNCGNCDGLYPRPTTRTVTVSPTRAVLAVPPPSPATSRAVKCHASTESR